MCKGTGVGRLRALQRGLAGQQSLCVGSLECQVEGSDLVQRAVGSPGWEFCGLY